LDFLLKSPFAKGGFRGISKPLIGRNFWQTLNARKIPFEQ
jgi:hypothetical protein